MSERLRKRLMVIGIRDSFAGDVLKLVTGSSFAQLIAIAISPILARLFAPEAFGTAAVFASLIAIIGPVSCLRYELAIVLPTKNREAANVLALSIAIATIVTAISAMAVWLADGLILSLLNAPELAPILWLLPILVFFGGLSLSLNYWNTRIRRYGRLSVNRVLNATMASFSKLVLGLLGQVNPTALIIGNGAGTILASSTLSAQTWSGSRHKLRTSVAWKEMLAALRRYKKFPLFSSWTAIINSVSWQLPVLMLSANFDAAIVGYYSFGNRLVRMPMMLIGSAIAQVFFQRASDADKTGQLSLVVRNAYARLVSIGLFPALLLTIIGRELFVLVFGEAWEIAGLYTEIMSIYMFFNFIAAPLGQLFSVLERQEIALITNIALLSTRLASLWIGGNSGNDVIAIALFSVSGVAVYGAYSMWIVREAGVSPKEWLIILARTLLIAGGFLAAAWFVVQILRLPTYAALVTYAASGLVYYGWLLRSDEQLLNAIRQASSPGDAEGVK